MQKQLLPAPRVPVRMGIHIGEIYIEGGKIFGDGVNVASRIESIGQGGTVLFSKDVFEKIKNHHEFHTMSIGKFDFKNVDESVEVFALTNPEVITPDLKLIEGKLKVIPKKKKWNVELILSVLVLVLTAGYFLALQNDASTGITSDIASNKSIAVLPFKNLSAGEQADFLSTGIAEDILTQLAQIHGLKVISRSSSMRYKDSNKAIKTIAKELGVTSILEGSVRQFENSLRLSVQLTHGTTENLIWAAEFDRDFEDILNVQRDVALAVSEQLKIALDPGLRNKLEDKYNVNPEAYVHYQLGQDILKRSTGTKEDVDAAIRYFELAIRADSTFVKGWIGLADAWLDAVYWHRISHEVAIPKAREASMKALSIDPDISESYGILGAINLLEKDLVSAEKNLRKSLALNSNNPFAYERLTWAVMFLGKEKEAIEILNKAIELDPLSNRNKGSVATMYYLMREYKPGIKIIKGYLEQNPTDDYLLWSLGYLLAGEGKYEEAIDVLMKRSIGTTTNWVLGYCYAKSGDIKNAQIILNNNIEKAKTQPVPDFMLAVQYLALNQKEKALEHLDKSIESGGEGFFVVGLDDDPMLKPLWKDPEFKQIVLKMKKAYKL
jgi:TolB-like protein/Flp pilus assembly protein TadD